MVALLAKATGFASSKELPCLRIEEERFDEHQHVCRYSDLGQSVLTLSVWQARKVDNAELPRPMAGEKSRQKNINLFLRAYLGNHAS